MSQSPLLRYLRARDRLWNVILGGDDEETISHRVARARARGVWWGRAACWSLSQVGRVYRPWRQHCDDVLAHPSPSDATVPLDAPLTGDANHET
jgi:hypothetical protein